MHIRPMHLILAAVCIAASTVQADAQSVTVHGVAFDSLRITRLRGALLSIEQSGQTAISDDSGRFRFEDVAPGPHTLVMQHDALDSLGIAVVRRAFTVSDGRESVRIAIPSFETFWRRACGGARAPQDSGFVFGALRDARTNAPLRDASMFITWSEIEFDKAKGVSQSLMGGEVRSDGDGSFIVCGVPTGMMLQLTVAATEYATIAVEVPLAAPGVLRQDIFVRARTDSLLYGTVRGIVRGIDGAPVARAGVTRAGAQQLLTDAEGRFVLSGVPIGTTALDVRSIGSAPFTAHVYVQSQDTVDVTLSLRKLSVLQEVRVSATSLVVQRFMNELDERRALGIATLVDSSVISKRATIVGALANVANLWVDKYGKLFIGTRGGVPCGPRVFIDRRQVDVDLVQDELRAVSVEYIGVIEVYKQGTIIPAEFIGRGEYPCAVMLIWTKRMFP